MFRRRRFPFRRKRFSRRGFRPFAGRVRPKYDRIVLFNTLSGDVTDGQTIGASNDSAFIVPCGPAEISQCRQQPGNCAPCAGGPCPDNVVCCGQNVTFRLVNNTVLESDFQDRTTIVSLYGDVWIKDQLNLPIDSQLCDSTAPVPSLGEYVARYAQQVSLGLRRFNSTMAALANVGSPPDEASPIYTYDWTEARWLWQRHRFWAPRPTYVDDRTVKGSVMGCCGDVSGGALNIVPPIASGDQPTYDIDTRVSTSCNPCIPNAEGACLDQRNSMSVQAPPWQHFRMRIKRHIALRADDNLDLQVGLRHPVALSAAAGGYSGWGCDSAEFPNEQSTWVIHLRLGAVVRLN